MSGNNFNGIGQKPLTGMAPQYKDQAANLSVSAKSPDNAMPLTAPLSASNPPPPAAPVSPVDEAKAKVMAASEQGGMAYIQAIKEIDPNTADALQNSFIQQKASLLRGYNSTQEMPAPAFHQYAKDTVGLANIGLAIQAAKPEDRAVVYQQNIDKIKAIDPTAPNDYKPNYVSMAVIEGKPFMNAIAKDSNLAEAMKEPLSKQQVGSLSPQVADKMADGTKANLVFKNASGDYKVFETTDAQGNKTFMIDNAGKVKNLDSGSNTIGIVPALDKSVQDKALAQRDAELKKVDEYNSLGMTKKQGIILEQLKNAKSPEEKAAMGVLFESAVQDEVKQREAALQNEYKLQQIAKYNELKKLQNGNDDTVLTKQSVNKLQSIYYTNNQVINKLQQAVTTFKDDDIQQLLTTGGKLKGSIAAIADTLGAKDTKLLGALDGKTAGEWVATKGKLKGPIYLAFQAFRTQITGAAAAEKELAALEKNIINGNMSPTEFKQAWNNLLITASTENDRIKESLKSGKLPDSVNPTLFDTGIDQGLAAPTADPVQDDADLEAALQRKLQEQSQQGNQ